MIIKGTNKKGAAMILVVLFFIIISTTLLIGISSPISNQIKGTNEFLTSKSSYNIADSQAENALYRFNKGKNDAPTDIGLLGATATAVLTDINGEKSLVVEGTKSIFNRYMKAVFKTGDGISFNYGLQLGNGGLVMDGSAHVNGNVYANGDITGVSGGPGWYNTYISGSAIAATVANPTLSISVSTTTQTLTVFPFGQSNTNQDVAQSFIAGTTTPISQINLYIKKTGTPANVTVKIVNNNSGVPGSTVITSGTLNASTVTTSYAYVPTFMSTAVSLTSGATYWLVVDNGSNNASNYYSLATYTNTYFDGITKQGRFGNSFTDLSPGTQDFDFSVLVGGDAGSITNIGVGISGAGDAWANTVTNTTVTGSLYCQSGSGNNKVCDISRADPVSVAYPVSSANITEWETDAAAGGSTSTVTIAGSATRSLGPIKINGNLTVTAGGNLNITGPIYVTGNVVIDGNSDVTVDSSLGNSSAVITTDGSINISTSGNITGAGSYSYLVFNSDKTCTTTSNCTSAPSITVSGDAGAIILNALNGGVSLTGSANVKAIVAKQLYMNGGTSVTYESGLADINFTSGPSGSWIKKSWKEVLGW